MKWILSTFVGLLDFAFCQGVPVRIELGPRDVRKGMMVMVRRDTGDKVTVKLDGAADSVKKLLEDIHEAMFAKYVIASLYQFH